MPEIEPAHDAARGEPDGVALRTSEPAPPLVAEVTLASVERLGLRDGVVTWASFKAVEVEILPA